MKINNQVVSLELAKRLKKLNCKQDSLWYWVKFDAYWFLCLKDKKGEWFNPYDKGMLFVGCRPFYSAFTVAELGKMLSKYENYSCYSWFDNKRRPLLDWHWSINAVRRGFNSRSGNYEGYENYNIIESNEHVEANARGKMLLYLLENKYIPTMGGER